ncbi:MAG: hypothetical protein WCP39_05305 [Chlamydiota bacterium]
MDLITLKAPGNFLPAQAERWRTGIWTATSSSLTFSNKDLIIWSCVYTSIVNLNLEKHPFAFGQKESIHIQLDKKNPAVWLLVENVKKWKNFICSHMLHQPFIPSEEQVSELAQELDVVNEEILWYLWKNKQATLSELSILRTIPDQSDVLRRIKSIINPLAKELFGFPFCIFKSERKIPHQNKTITNSWWLYHLDS